MPKATRGVCMLQSNNLAGIKEHSHAAAVGIDGWRIINSSITVCGTPIVP